MNIVSYCILCNEEFVGTRSRKYCSKKCANAYLKKTNKEQYSKSKRREYYKKMKLKSKAVSLNLTFAQYEKYIALGGYVWLRKLLDKE